MGTNLDLPPRSGITRSITMLVLHCSATPNGQRIGGRAPGQPGYRNPTSHINDWHGERGFKRSAAWVARFNSQLKFIGYHYVVDVDGRVWLGRHLCEVGAHAAGHNAASVGICMVGGAEREGRYTAPQWAATAELVQQLAAHLEVPWMPAVKDVGICGHRDLSPDANGNGRVEPKEWLKTCPGFDVAAWLKAGCTADAGHVFQDAAP